MSARPPSVVHLTSAHPRFGAHPVKMFEYMSASLPVINSNFPLWRRIVETNDGGIRVEPTRARQFAAAIDALVPDPGRARELAANGAAAIQARYNWRFEEHKLLALYRQLVSAMSSRRQRGKPLCAPRLHRVAATRRNGQSREAPGTPHCFVIMPLFPAATQSPDAQVVVAGIMAGKDISR